MKEDLEPQKNHPRFEISRNFLIYCIHYIYQAFIQLSERDKDSGVQQIIKKISFNLCVEQEFDNLFEKAIFYEVFNGFRVEGMGKLCPIKV